MSVASVEEAMQNFKDIRTTLKLGGFNLMKWIFNKEVDSEDNPDEDRPEAKKNLWSGASHFHTCGHGVEFGHWHCENLSELWQKQHTRSSVSFVAYEFDHLGLFCTIHESSAHSTEDNLGEMWTSVAGQIWWRRQRAVPGMGARTGRDEEHASEETIVWQKLRKYWLA